MNCSDAQILSACLGGIVHPRVTQTQPIDVSLRSIAMENSLHTIVYLTFKCFQVFQCVSISYVHAHSPQIITVDDKDHFLLRVMC